MSGDLGLVDETSGVPLSEPWMSDAACAQVDPELFFPDEENKSTPLAKKVCSGCDVVGECLAYALRTDQRYGIWGNTSERQRRSLVATGDSVVEERLRALVGEGLTDVLVAERLGLTVAQVRWAVKRLGLPSAASRRSAS